MGLFGGIGKLILPAKNKNTAADSAYENSDTFDAKYKNRTVLVGVVRNTDQFNILLKKKFYHIPISQLNGCYFPIKYIAIYQSKKLFGKACGVKIFGEVESCVTLPRKDITEIPKNSEEKYMYFKIKKWCRLSNHIKANDMDLTAFSTTPYLLSTVKNSAELQFRSQSEQELCRILIKKVRKYAEAPFQRYEDMVYGDFVLQFKDGAVFCYFGDVFQSGISYEKFLERPTDLIRDIFDYYPEE